MKKSNLKEVTQARQDPRYYLTSDQYETFYHDLYTLRAVADAVNASFNTGDGPEPENRAPVTALIFEKLQDLTQAFKEFGEQEIKD